jgi:hypothetical protein
LLKNEVPLNDVASLADYGGDGVGVKKIQAIRGGLRSHGSDDGCEGQADVIGDRRGLGKTC